MKFLQTTLATSILLFLPTLLFAQPQQSAKARIQGIVTVLGTNEAISEARLTLTKTTSTTPPRVLDPRLFRGSPPPAIRPAISDINGHFAFNDLDAGSYRLTIMANGFVGQEYGQRVIGGPVSLIVVVPGQAASDLVIRMTPAGTVSGHIRDSSGRPVAGTSVELFRRTYTFAGVPVLQSAGFAQTDDLGAYRLYWVAPGKYYVAAGSADGSRPRVAENFNQALSFDQESRAGNNRVETNYSRAYYPGVADAERATTIEVQTGAERNGVDFIVGRQRLYRIRGRVVDSKTGLPPEQASIYVGTQTATGVSGFGGAFNYDSRTGMFEVSQLTPGTYGVTVNMNGVIIPYWGGAGTAVPTPRASVLVVIRDNDADGLVFTIAPPPVVTGRVTAEDPLPPDFGLNRLLIQLRSSEAGIVGTISPRADGTFRMNSIPSGEYLVSMTQLPPGFYLKTASFAGTDALTNALPYSISGELDITISSRSGQLHGTVTGERRDSMSGIQVVLVPEKLRDRTDLFKSVTTESNGRFAITGIPPGEYRVLAWEVLEPYTYFDPDVLRRFESQGKTIHVNESSEQTLDLTSDSARSHAMIVRMAVVALLLQAASTPAAQQISKGSIEGIVVRMGSNQPIEGARVSLTKSPIVLNLTRMSSPSSVITDSDGKFAFKELDAESYRLTFGSDGYVRQEYGQRVFPGQGSPIELTAGQAVKNIVVRMTPTGSVSGRIRDSDKNPLVSVPIQLMRYVYDSLGRRTLQAFGNARTNDQGEYRIYFVTPGRYYLNAGTLGYDTPAAGRSEVRDSYVSRFYPGVANVREASVIDVQPDAEVRGIDLTIARQQAFRVRGRLVDSTNGQSPARADVRLIYRNPVTGQDEDFSDVKGDAVIYDKGSFEFRDVLPGSFLLAATADDPAEPVAQPVEGPGERRLPVRALKHTGGVRIDVVNSDLNDVLLTISGGASISGKITAEGAKSIPSPPAQIGVYLTPSTNGLATSVFSIFTPGTSTINSDGTFRIQNVTAGEYRIDYESRWPPGFYLMEARLGGTDILNRPLQFSGSESGTLEIVLSSNMAVVEGNVRSDLLVPVPAARVVLVPERNRNRVDLYRSVSTDNSGHFTIPNAAPGDYKIFAWEALEPFSYFDPELLRQFEAKSISVHLGDLSRLSVDLKVIPTQ